MKLLPDEALQISAYVMPDIPEGRSDIGLIFGTRHGVEEFCVESYSLWKRGMFNKLLVSGGCTHGEPESEASVIGKRLMELGMPADALILEQDATNTGENVILAHRKISETMDLNDVKSVLVIGKVCSMRRYLMTIERHWPGLKKFACPINYFGVPKNRWYEHDEFRMRVLSEFEKIPQYLKLDYLTELADLVPYPNHSICVTGTIARA